MPLSAAAPRKAQHIRRYEAIGYLREDGLYDIEGHLTDEKTYPFDNRWRGTVVPGEKLHDMHLRLTINDDMEIVAVEAATEASPFSLCGDITASYQQLVGLRIVSGFSRKALERIGGVKGCTHISELLRVLGVVAFQTLWPVIHAKQKAAPEGSRASPTALLNSCHAYAANSPVVETYFPEHYQPAKSQKNAL